MNIDTKTIIKQLQPIGAFAKKYINFIFFLAISLACAFLIYQINALTSREPTDEAVQEQLKRTTRPKIDQQSITRIQQLQDQNISVQSLFEDARNNPFSE